MKDKKTIKILIVEDDKDQIQMFIDSVDEYNQEEPVQVEYNICKTLTEGLESLKTPLFDAAIIDLKLSGKNELEGMNLVNEVNSKLRIPIFIVSGSLGQIVHVSETALLKKRDRIKGFDLVLKEIVQIYNTGITNILGSKGVVENLLNDIFWKHFPNSLDTWLINDGRTLEQREKSLLRYTLLHMQEYIDVDIEEYHPSEFYITAPIKKNIFTGDIVNYENNRYVVLTPSCDMVIRSGGTINAKKIFFCKIVKLNDVIANYDLLSSATGKNNNNRIELNKYIENKKQNYHFIPKSNLIDAGLIDFQDKITINVDEVQKQLNSCSMTRISTVSMPFLKDIISRFSSYYARQGSPDFNTDEIYKTLFK